MYQVVQFNYEEDQAAMVTTTPYNSMYSLLTAMDVEI